MNESEKPNVVRIVADDFTPRGGPLIKYQSLHALAGPGANSRSMGAIMELAVSAPSADPAQIVADMLAKGDDALRHYRAGLSLALRVQADLEAALWRRRKDGGHLRPV